MLLSFVLLAVAACQERRSDPDAPVAEPPFAVIPAATIADGWRLLAGCSGQETVGLRPGWTPSASEAAAIDVRLRPLLDSLLAHRSDALRSMDYVVQYYGVYRDTARLIVANGSSRRMNVVTDSLAAAAGAKPMGGEAWRVMVLLHCDAGALVFRAVFDGNGRIVDSLRFGSPM